MIEAWLRQDPDRWPDDIRRGYVVTTGKFNVPARDFAEEKHLTLLPGDIFLEKLNAFRRRIGCPDKWIDYSSLSVGRKALVENVFAASAFRAEISP